VKSIAGFVAFVIVLLIFIPLLLGLWLDWQWFAAQGVLQVLALRLRTELVLGGGAALLAGATLYLNLAVVSRRLRSAAAGWNAPLATARRAIGPASAILGLAFGLSAMGQWSTYLTAMTRRPFGMTDPVFGQDASFYVWVLPALEALHAWVVWLALMLIVTAAALYGVGFALIAGPAHAELHGLRVATNRPPSTAVILGHPLLKSAEIHASLLGAILLALFAVSYVFDTFELVYSGRGVVYGASRTDLAAVMPANVILLLLTLGLAAVLGVNLVWRRRLALLAAPAIWVVAAFLLGGLWPGAYEQFAVKPNQLEQERPYLANNIAMTRQAYGLDRVDTRDLSGDGTLKADDLSRNQDALADLRITDYRPLLDAYRQLQRLRQQFDFVDVDVDRYNLTAGRQQVMLSARELDPGGLPEVARTWQNLHLVYTHGQGVVASPVNRVTAQGLPELLVRDVPAVSTEPSLLPNVPQVYFGELTTQYVIVGTKLAEFDRPGESGSAEVTSRYEGGGGVPVGGLLQRILLTLSLADLNVLLSDAVSPDSQVLLHRTITDRVHRTAPFLLLDSDPYLVIVGGRLVWVQDAYTTTRRFPHATPRGDLNYIRNSVKVTVDAYSGEMRFYAFDPDEPILQVYRALYPTLFIPLDAAPAGLADHFRYPEDLFNIQAAMLATYHMTDPQQFYNREDLWNIAQETYGDRVQQMVAYFATLRLPGEAAPEFTTILPFTPGGGGRTNMVAWMAARSDAPHYGELRLYRFPQGKLVFGPQQIEARVNQEPSISQQLTLWNQQGSKVIRGNLLAIPIEESILYVQPLYIQAERNPLPELNRVIVASTEGVVMSDRLDGALAALAQGRRGEVAAAAASPRADTNTGTPPGAASGDPAGLARQARDRLREAQAAAGAGDWATYGQKLAEVDRLLNQLAGG